MIAIFPELKAVAAKKDIELLSILVRKYFAGKSKFSPNLNVEGLLESIGIQVHQMDINGHGSIISKDEKGEFKVAIALAGNLKSFEERFLLSHQLGHFLFDMQPLIAEGDLRTLGFSETVLPSKRYANSDYSINSEDTEVERLSDDFAAALLMPKAMVLRAHEKLGDIQKTAEFFHVTELVLKRRLDQLEVEQRSPNNFFDAESRTGRKISDLDRVDPPAATKQNMEDGLRGLKLNTKLTPPSAKVVYESSEEPVKPKTKISGMDRIRQIAKMLDRNH